FVLFSTILITLSSIDTMNKIPYFRGEYYFFLVFSALGMMLMASANDMLSLYLSLEFSTFGFYILVAYFREDVKSNEAGIKYFILGVLSSAIIIYGISLVYGATGTIRFTELANTSPSLGVIIGLMFIFTGLGYKIGAVPFHAWIPDVYQGAPTPVTSFLSVAPKGAAFAITLRVVLSTFSTLRSDWTFFFVCLAVLSMTYGNIVAIAQKNMKRLLAYSGIAQIGNILVGLAAGTKMGGEAILFYLVAYLFANVGAFAVIIAFSNLTNRDDIGDLAGLNRRSPFLAFSLLVFLLSLAGVPPFGGFIAKLYIFSAAMNQNLIFLVVVGLINIVISMYYYLVVVKSIYIAEPIDPSPIPISHSLKAVVYISLGGVFLLGMFPKIFLDWSIAATEIFKTVSLH
ncbi:NADH-quinone oxidoreductase subunit N, partial [Nitrospira defluvii]|nr:NADH-quinone oxidoreductase subunit N [Nitrospira defluvii]